MCRPTNATAPLPRRSSRLLLTHDSFVFDDLPDKDDANKRKDANPHLHGLGGPSLLSTLLTVAFYVGVLFVVEHIAGLFISKYTHLDPILEVELNRHIIARHVVVDFLSLVCCAYVAVTNRDSCSEIIEHFKAWGKSDSMGDDQMEERVFRYRPGAQRLLTLFFVYQVKNMYDTIYYDEGIVFVLHHIFAGAAAWGGMFPGCCHFHALFYFRLSEISTAILCLLANFDPELGVVGLDKVFPKTKIVLGALFVASFVVCRMIMWPFWTYYTLRDVRRAIKSDSPRADGRRGYLWVILTSCVSLSLIQLVFVGMIVQTGKEELDKLMNA
ncbi:hypothetical protein ACHAXT_011688 [Thalassiosira profunda]